jgi:hypothetical protein
MSFTNFVRVALYIFMLLPVESMTRSVEIFVRIFPHQVEQPPLPAKSLAEVAGMPLENVDHFRPRGFATPVALEFTNLRNHG